MQIKSQKDFFSGLLFIGVGVAFAWGATTYNVGESARMGPGYFPLMLGIVLALIGGGGAVHLAGGGGGGRREDRQMGLAPAVLRHHGQPAVRRAAGGPALHRPPYRSNLGESPGKAGGLPH